MGIYTNRKLFGTTRRSVNANEGSDENGRKGFSKVVISSVISSSSIKAVRAIGSSFTGGKIKGRRVSWITSTCAIIISAFVCFLRFMSCRLFNKTVIKSLRIT